MGRIYSTIEDRLASWVQEQPVFFVGTAPLAGDGHINVSPKGNRGELVVLDGRRVAYLEQTGSGVETIAHLRETIAHLRETIAHLRETIAHLRESGRIVVMWCAFDGPPRIVRFHGTGAAVRPGDGGWDELAAAFRAAGGDPAAPGSAAPSCAPRPPARRAGVRRIPSTRLFASISTSP